MYLWESLNFYMFEQDSALAHRACKKVEFLDRETSDFMSRCCSELKNVYCVSTKQHGA